MLFTVNIVVGGGDVGWIAGRMSRELAARLPTFGIGVTTNGPQADLEYQQIVYGAPTSRPAVGLFTHDAVRPRRFAKDYDGHVALNSATQEYLREAGVSYPKLITLASTMTPKHPIVFGVAGRTYGDGRKGQGLVAGLVAEGFTVKAWGSGWPCEIVSDRVEDLPNFYRSLDYLIDTDYSEGGCVADVDCMALGVPVISHTCGITRPVIPYERGSFESLRDVVQQLACPRTYDDWASEHATLFKLTLDRLSQVVLL